MSGSIWTIIKNKILKRSVDGGRFQWKTIDLSDRNLIAIGGSLLVAGLVISFFRPEAIPPEPRAAEEIQDLDLLIPSGHTLLPMEFANKNALESILGPYGIIDIYGGSDGSAQKVEPLAERVKVLRSPRDPSQLGVLAPTVLIHHLLKHPGPYFAVVKGREDLSPSSATERKKERVKWLE